MVGALNTSSKELPEDGLMVGALNTSSKELPEDGLMIGALNTSSNVFPEDGVIFGAVNTSSYVFPEDGVRFSRRAETLYPIRINILMKSIRNAIFLMADLLFLFVHFVMRLL